jgi:hypothetical protein
MWCIIHLPKAIAECLAAIAIGGPIWFPINFLIVESLQRFHFYYDNSLKVELPTGSGNFKNLNEIAENLSRRLSNIFLKMKKENVL